MLSEDWFHYRTATDAMSTPSRQSRVRTPAVQTTPSGSRGYPPAVDGTPLGSRGSFNIAYHFQILTTPSLPAEMMKFCGDFVIAISLIHSWCPTGGCSGPLRGISSWTTPCRGLQYTSWKTSVPSIKRDLKQSAQF